MGLFQRKTQTTTSAPLYTLGFNKTLLIIGLGNPGKKYIETRHNIGFACIDNFAQKLEFPAWTTKKQFRCWVAEQTISGSKVILVKPTAFMNLSGKAVQSVKHFYKLDNEQILAIYDELDIPFGQIRTRKGGSSAGHNGVKSLIEHLGEDFGRLRIGIKNILAEKAGSSNFVLSEFGGDEKAELPALTREVNSILSEYVHGQPLAAETRNFLV